MRLQPRSHRRGGFTLVELLVVIAIIVLLIGLLTGTVQKIRVSGQKVQVGNDINNFNTAITAFKTKYRVDYIPSQIILPESLSTFVPSNQLEQDSLTYLRKLWPRLGDNDWNANGTIDPPHHLYGPECLVFFLGGIPRGGVPTGFSTDPRSPAAPSNEKILSFEFESNRLDASPNSPGFLVYRDTFGAPFTYFSSYGKRTGYNKYGSDAGPNNYVINRSGVTITVNLSAASPLAENANKFAGEGFQIISAGPNNLFGPGGAWSPGNGLYGGAFEGADDMANFNSGKPLGSFSQ